MASHHAVNPLQSDSVMTLPANDNSVTIEKVVPTAGAAKFSVEFSFQSWRIRLAVAFAGGETDSRAPFPRNYHVL